MVFNLLFRRHAPLNDFSLPRGERVYAIGDVHGRRDLLEDLVEKIDLDDAARPKTRTTLILLGDLVDRGPDSAGVVDLVMSLAAERSHVRVLKGNHEEAFLRALDGDTRAMRAFYRMGGRETLLSYGIDRGEAQRLDDEALVALVQQRVPYEHRCFLAGMEDLIEIGDYVFVHAGIRPGVALEAQKGADLRWIRSEFLNSAASHGRMVVHGHTIVDKVAIHPNRIGIDTGAYLSGRLTAVGLEDRERWFLST